MKVTLAKVKARKYQKAVLYLTLSASGNFCHLLITFANSLDPDQAQQNVGPDLDPNCFDTLIVLKTIQHSIKELRRYGTIIKFE